MSSLTSWLLLLLLNVFQFALSVDAKGGGKSSGSKGSGSKSSKKGSSSNSTPQTVVYHSNGKCYDEQHVQIKCPYSKSTIITTIVVGSIAGILLLVALVTWLLSKRKEKRRKTPLDAESKGAHDASEDSQSKVPLVHEELSDEKDGGVSEYSSDDEKTCCDHSDEKPDKH